MTKDEAREILQKDGCGYGCFIPSRKNCDSTDCLLKEAVTMAIKAIEQIEKIKSIINGPVYMQGDIFKYRDICKVLKEAEHD